MKKSKTAEAYYAEEARFKKEINQLRALAAQTEANEDCKWGMPVYTIENKNVFGICRFKNHFGVWFYNGAFMDDPKKVLENAQEGKTKAMRHWKFNSGDEIDEKEVLRYLKAAIKNQKEGKVLIPSTNKKKEELPELLAKALNQDNGLKSSFDKFTSYKQKEFVEYISEAKQESAKLRRLRKILPMIEKGIGLNDRYR